MRRFFSAIILLCGLVCASCASRQPDRAIEGVERPPPAAAVMEVGPQAASDSEPAIETSGIRYVLTLTGDAPDPLIDLLRNSSTLISLQGKPPISIARLEGRVGSDMERFTKVLRSEGYYAGRLDRQIERAADGYRVEIRIMVGPRYVISKNQVTYQTIGNGEGNLPRILDDFGLARGAPARSADVIAAERSLIRSLQQRGRPFAKGGTRRITVDHGSREMAVTLVVQPGVAASFGDPEFNGVRTIDEEYLRQFVTWKPGEDYDRRKRDALAARLRATGLFESVEVVDAPAVGGAGRLPIRISVVERKHRSIGFGGEFSTDIGASGTAFWEHRNFLGRAEQVRGSATIGEIRQEAGLDVRLPHFGRIDQDIVSETKLKRQTTDAFDEISASQSLRLERQLDSRWRSGGGGSLDFSEIEENLETRQFAILGLPLFIARDSRDSIMEPTRGGRVRLDMTPYQTFIDESATLARAEILGTKYLKLVHDARIIAAGRAKVGSIFGADNDEIPASKLFFAGGGGSIRGFEFQKAGRLDEFGDPIGGSSLIEAGLELRFRVQGPFGAVAFIDAGNVYDTTLPQFSDPPIRVGAGAGLRYNTAIGPLRLDVAVPVNGRDEIDDDYQIYLGFGQAF